MADTTTAASSPRAPAAAACDGDLQAVRFNGQADRGAPRNRWACHRGTAALLGLDPGHGRASAGFWSSSGLIDVSRTSTRIVPIRLRRPAACSAVTGGRRCPRAFRGSERPRGVAQQFHRQWPTSSASLLTAPGPGRPDRPRTGVRSRDTDRCQLLHVGDLGCAVLIGDLPTISSRMSSMVTNPAYRRTRRPRWTCAHGGLHVAQSVVGTLAVGARSGPHA